MRLIPIIFGLLLICHSAIELKFVGSTAASESAWCRVWFCQTDLETQHELDTYLGSGIKQAPKSVAGFAEILRRDPASAFRWCDFAEAMVESGQTDQARYAIDRALVLSPHNAPVLLRVANWFFRVNDIPQALHAGRTILGQVRDYDAILFSVYDRFEIPVETLLHDGLPVDRPATRSYFSHLLTTPKVADAGTVWTWLSKNGFADDPLAGSYVSYLLHYAQYENAQRSWANYLGSRRGNFPDTNSMFDGGFETEPTGSPLDWQIGSTEGVQVRRDTSDKHSGQYSVQLQFAGTSNVAFSQVAQSSVVTAGSYKLEYFIKTSGITTNEGVRLRVFDSQNPAALDLLSDPATGNTEWRRVDMGFRVTPRTHLIQVQIVRLPSQKFDNKIAGSAWVDSVRLYRVGS